jgi:GH24 family phage-related lysozyme (muramidase)
LIVFSYNIGMGNFKASTTLREINTGHTPLGCYAMVKYSCVRVKEGTGDRSLSTKYPGVDCRTPTFNKIVSKGLYDRRNEEKQMCLSGVEVKT